MWIHKLYKFGLAGLLLSINSLALGFSFDNFAVRYSDVDLYTPYYPAIYYFTAKEIVKGYKDGHFGANELINRAEALKIILSFANVDMKKNDKGNNIYKDVSNDDWYKPYVISATNLKIIEVDPKKKAKYFYPSTPLTTAEALKMILNINNMQNQNNQESLSVKDGQQAIVDEVNGDISPEIIFAIDNDLIWEKTAEIDSVEQLTRGEFLDLLYRFSFRNNKSKIIHSSKATYYGNKLNGKSTSSGEKYNSKLYTAAHKFLPFGTILTVVNLNNGKEVKVKVNDRGPYRDGFDLDLSTIAFETIAPLSQGIANVWYFVEPS